MVNAIQPVSRWVPESLALPDQVWLVPGFVPQAGLTLITGRPKYSKKSWIALLLSLSMSSGKTTSGFEPTGQYKGLILSREGPIKPTAERFTMLERGHGISVADTMDHLWIKHGGSFLMDNSAHCEDLQRTVEAHKLDYVVIDTLSRSMSGEENSAQDMMRALRITERLRDVGCATILVHHTNKAAKGQPGPLDADNGMRGSSALAGSYDHIISVQQAKVEDEHRDFWVVGGKMQDYVAYEPEWAIDESTARLKLSEKMEVPSADEPSVLNRRY